MSEENNKPKIRIRNPFFISVLVLLVFYILLRFVIQPPLPSSIIWMYMVTLTFSLILYVSSSEKTFQEFILPIHFFLLSPTVKIPRLIAGIIIPLFFGGVAYNKVLPDYTPPAEARNIHPAPPSKITVHDESITLAEIKNPFRAPDKIEEAKKEGWKIYYSNCVSCHGDNLSGNGHWANRLNPMPIDFRDLGTISQMPESYIFWRIAKGGQGLPGEGAPWNSAMPVWEHTLSTDEIWKVALFIYEETGQVPKTFE